MSERVARAESAWRACRICPRNCGVDRFVSSRGAFCRLGEHAYVYKELLSRGEEAVLDPTWLVDLGGCSLRCLFCTEWTNVTEPQLRAVQLDSSWFVPRLRQRKLQGAKTLSFVGGDPTVSLLGVLRALAQVPEAEWLPVVWNCNGLLSDPARDLLQGIVACWVIDLKFGNPQCAQRVAGVPETLDLFAEVAKSLEFAERAERRPEDQHLPPLLVRHLVMPGHLACCTRPVLTWLARNHPNVPVNLMTVYLPAGPAAQGLKKVPELADIAGSSEVQAAIQFARETTSVLWLDGKP